MDRRILGRLLVGAGLVLLLGVTVTPVFAQDGGHHHDEAAAPLTGPLSWAMLAFGAIVVIGIGAVFATHPAPSGLSGLAQAGQAQGLPLRGLRSYADKLGRFNRNSRLLLLSNLLGLRPPLGGLGFGIWNVAFNLYLLSLGFSPEFIGTVLALRMLFHGLLVLPAGLICDAIGRRRSFLMGGVASVAMILLLSSTQNPTLLLVIGALSGLPLSLEHVAWEPFMMENSGEAERPYLFSMNATIGMVAIMAGSTLAALLPAAFGRALGVEAMEVVPLRLTVLSVAALQALSLIPLYLIRPSAQDLMPAGISLANIQSRNVIGRLVLVSGLTGLAMGFVMQFYNVYFAAKFGAGADSIGIVLAVGSGAAILSTALAPMLAERLGKVRMVSYVNVLSAPFILSLAWAPGLVVAGVLYFFANGLRVMGLPILSAFSMEQVQRRERATTIGLTHLAFDILNTPSTYLAGAWIAGANYGWPFSLAAGVVAVWALLFLRFFDRQSAARSPAPVTGG